MKYGSMNSKTKLILWFCLLLALLISMAVPAVANPEPQPEVKPPVEDKATRPIKHVLVIVMSGVSMDALLHTYTPTFNELIKEGVRVEQSSGVYPTKGPSALASLITGANPERHGLLKPSQKLNAESVFQVWQSRGLVTLLAAGPEEEFAPLSGGFTHKAFVAGGTDKAITDRGLELWKNAKPFATLVVLSQAEKEAKTKGPYSQDHLKAITESDQQAARWIRMLKEAGLYDDTLTVIVSDYGLAPRSQERTMQNIDRELIVPLLMRGPRLKTGVTIPPARTIDVAATLAQLTGNRVPAQSEGAVLWNAFLPNAELNQESLYEKRVNDLALQNLNLAREAYQLAEDKININGRIDDLQEQKQQMQNFTEEKEQTISSLERKVTWQRYLIGAIVLLALLGFLVEYWLLRKRFLLFD
ncbi:alkaline phosphatase family protein [Heliobacterium chlorum]|uniref:Alkaline phosphatase family protein n=1 Tax=Heliobacterium chlorum TaxID=2698 RepID=A0ABR7T6D2_HELCL|nr:alkaline phosphatase family protein [Heliobacterium chlorum]MBC9785573.1 alkaline phosphatase family protein [Heliobacterium chlorum]